MLLTRQNTVYHVLYWLLRIQFRPTSWEIRDDLKAISSLRILKNVRTTFSCQFSHLSQFFSVCEIGWSWRLTHFWSEENVLEHFFGFLGRVLTGDGISGWWLFGAGLAESTHGVTHLSSLDHQMVSGLFSLIFTLFKLLESLINQKRPSFLLLLQ